MFCVVYSSENFTKLDGYFHFQRKQFTEVREILVRIHRAKIQCLLVTQLKRLQENSPIPNHQLRLRHRLSCLVLVQVHVCKLDGLLRSWVRLNVGQWHGDELFLSERCASMSMERFQLANGGTVSSIRYLRLSNTFNMKRFIS